MLSQKPQLEQTNNVVVAAIPSRELSAEMMQELVEELMQRMRCDNAQHFVLDLREVEYIASSCIGVLVGFLQDLEHVRGRIGLARCQPNVLFLFKVTRLDSVFHLFDDVETAKAQIARQ
ncbi:MAG: STAS domain-containing protein [Planctomycetes bacterium]|nr:STAS domain-containing protein [Planctomycetota bacterium]